MFFDLWYFLTADIHDSSTDTAKATRDALIDILKLSVFRSVSSCCNETITPVTRDIHAQYTIHSIHLAKGGRVFAISHIQLVEIIIVLW